MKASFVPHGKKSGNPGFYLGISADTIHVGGGLFKVATKKLKDIRASIVAKPEAFESIIHGELFLQHFESLQGTQAKRLPAEWNIILEKIPELANKQFYAMQRLPLEDYISSEDLCSHLMAAFRAVQPLNTFLAQAAVQLS